MIIKEAVNENCTECGRFKKEVSPELHGCDQCSKTIKPYGNDDERLDVTVHDHTSSAKHFYFCSWSCVFKFARKVKTDYFFTLPYVSFDNRIVGRRAKDFLKEIKKIA